jgi:hypothetical protein
MYQLQISFKWDCSQFNVPVIYSHMFQTFCHKIYKKRGGGGNYSLLWLKTKKQLCIKLHSKLSFKIKCLSTVKKESIEIIHLGSHLLC